MGDVGISDKGKVEQLSKAQASGVFPEYEGAKLAMNGMRTPEYL